MTTDNNQYSPYETGEYYHSASLNTRTNVGNTWPFLDVIVKQPKEIKIFYVDSEKTGNTIGRFKTAKAAAAFAKKFGGNARPYCPSPAQRDAELQQLKEEKRFNSTAPHRPLTMTKRPKPRKIYSKE